MSVKINFVDMAPDFKPQTSGLAKLVEEAAGGYELSDKPDYVFVSPYSHHHLKYDCIKIFYTGENNIPDFNLFDYAIGFDHLAFGDRYLRCPLFAIRSAFKNFRSAPKPSPEKLLNREFCSFVVSNSAGDPIRTAFFHELSKYKRVASGGWHLNNVGGPVKDKLAFTSNYKFAITFENSSSPGYTTEKIMEPMAVWSVPIYWGDPLVTTDFNPQSFVNVKGKEDFDRAIEEIIRLDKDDDAYLNMCLSQPLVHPTDHYHQQLVNFLRHIFTQPLDKARRTIPYGYQATHYRKVYKEAFRRYDLIEKPINLARKIKHGIGL